MGFWLVDTESQLAIPHLAVGELLHPIAQGKDRKGLERQFFAERQVEMAGNEAVEPPLLRRTGKGADDLPVIPSFLFCLVA